MSDTYVKIRNEVLAGGGTSESPDEPTRQTAVTGLAVIGAGLLLLAVINPWMLLFVVGIILCIVLHEVGHFVTA